MLLLLLLLSYNDYCSSYLTTEVFARMSLSKYVNSLIISGINESSESPGTRPYLRKDEPESEPESQAAKTNTRRMGETQVAPGRKAKFWLFLQEAGENRFVAVPGSVLTMTTEHQIGSIK